MVLNAHRHFHRLTKSPFLMAKNYAKRDFKKRPPAAKAKKSFGFLWLLTGILIGGFGFGLLFLKKNITVVAEAPSEHVKPVKHPVAPAATSPPEVKTAVAEDKTRYDFYTMLPNSQATTNTTNAPPVVPKPVKTLAEAEQSMLSKTPTQPQQQQQQQLQLPPPAASDDTAVEATIKSIATKTTTSSEPSDLTALENSHPDGGHPDGSHLDAASKAKAVKKPADDGTRYSVESGSYSSYELADAHKAELTMAGFDHVHIESYAKGDDSTHHRVLMGPFKTKNEAVAVEKNLDSNHFSAELIAIP